MSEDNPRPRKSYSFRATRLPPDPVREAQSREVSRKYHASAASQINPDVREATPDLLARHVTEIDADDRLAFLGELIRQLSPDDLREVAAALRLRLGQEAA